MRSRINVRGPGVPMAAVLTAALTVGAATVQQEPAQLKAGRPGQAEIRRAIETVKAVPEPGVHRRGQIDNAVVDLQRAGA